jgi:hypothetical protein
MRRIAAAVLLAFASSGVFAAESRAQGEPPFLRSRAIEVDLGATWSSGVDFGTADATLTRNQSAQAAYTLFSTASTLGHAPGVEGRLGWHVTPTIAVEGAFLFSRPALETSISRDAEGAPSLTASETISQFLVDVSGVLHLRALRVKRAVPFVLGGAGYLRELHQGAALVETGHTYHVGGGAKMPLVTRRGFVRTLGLRLDGRLYFRSGGADLDDSRPTRTMALAGASLIVEF